MAFLWTTLALSGSSEVSHASCVCLCCSACQAMFQQASTHYEYNKQLQKPWCEGHWARVIESCLLRFFGTRQCPSTVVMTLFSTVSLYPANRTLLSWDGEDDFDQRTHDCKTESSVSLPVVEAFLDIHSHPFASAVRSAFSQGRSWTCPSPLK